MHTKKIERNGDKKWVICGSERMEEEKTWDERNEGGDAELCMYVFIDSLRNRGNAKPTTTMQNHIWFSFPWEGVAENVWDQ